MQAGFGILLMVLGLPMLIAVFAMWRGWVFSIVWGWFIVPFFHLPPLPVPMAIGISLIVGMLTYGPADINSEPPEDQKYRSLIFGVVFPALTLLIGWTVKQFL